MQTKFDRYVQNVFSINSVASSLQSLLIQSLTVELTDKSVLIVSLAAPIATLATTKQQLCG